jgi:hypothetical protein
MTKSRIGHRLVRTAVACGVGLFSVAGVAVPASIASAAASHPAASSSASKSLTISSTGLKSGAIKHVWLIILENKSYDATFTGLNQNSYLWKTLPKQGVLLKKYYGTGHTCPWCPASPPTRTPRKTAASPTRPSARTRPS